MVKIGSYCELNGVEPISDLQYGMDFRLPQHRREVFLRFYAFHLKYRSHPGAVYYAFPYLFAKLGMSHEQRLWFAFINGCSQNVITTYLIFEQFPDLHKIDMTKFSAWFRKHYEKLGWDTDRRYVKNTFEQCVMSYRENLAGRTQEEYFEALTDSPNHYDNFTKLWDNIITNFFSFGRLATFSYTEYLKIAGLHIDCNSLFLDDIDGSRSHRNGLCKVLGRDDMDWWKEPVKYDEQFIAWLKVEADRLIQDAGKKYPHPDLSFFTLESTLCCYKSWHRPNRRYPNVYNDMFYERIVYATQKWRDPCKFDIFWQCRKESLPKHLRIEDNPKDYGLDPRKQNHYLTTGEVIMMDKEYDCFSNRYNDYIR
jgi:hypothetical protein